MTAEPTILAFDTSAAHCVAALLLGGQIVAERHEEMGRGQAERLMPMLQALLDEVGAVWEELDAVAVGTGPGNFTGIRISVATARGLALGLGIPAVGVSEFEALRGPGGLHDTRPELVSLRSSRRGADVVVQVFDAGVAHGRPIELEVYGDAAAVRARLAEVPPGAPVVGAEAGVLTAILNEGRKSEPAPFAAYCVDCMGGPAAAIARVAAEKLRLGRPGPRPAPVYIRPADAAPSKEPPPVILP
ncbi:tRNA (adenosine(37)-N6)-threonylcarbamoyltransferase complex dimerization subunit type 1 TsaB [Salipiger sp. P9]|uniref:tRNA (adenosine(37)-N6)-threonylcarbamoyltransferase complex dimerization subunit type 1 TsaB n=1 Tax=Salipiger pentaromativorans TaxID=2943193 RepID=UPI0021570821|nr:tRNA (adenosine(37)-N6)-threonylcarbamoyltransferase complex dimerization subunit type 1 TsaB [Salipiger pentaromativorans]MCR8549459.1 tRNA (adenosine(37)-N6)-threonylcarbamoyltransferase complex dimerization subunit type 1 TsaB [Salipiger pentaromativorans]